MARKTKAPPPREITRRRLARWQRERRRRRVTVTIAGLVVAAVIAVIVYGIYATVIAPPGRLLSTVNDTSITAADYVKALRLNPYVGSPEEPLLALENNELVRQEAAELNIEVTDDEITEEIKSWLFPEDEEVSEEEFQERYQQLLDTLQLSDSEFRETFEVELLRGKLEDYLKELVAEVGEDVPQVHVQAILVTTEEQAQGVIDRLDGGEDFATIAEEYGQGDGDLGWLPQGIMSLEFDRVAFELEPDTVSEPFSTTEGYYIIKVSGKEDRALDEATRVQLEASAFNYWLEEQREEKVTRNPNIDLEEIYQWALDQIS